MQGMSALPSKLRRTALEALGRDALARLTEHFNLAVEDRRSAASHVDAVMRSRSIVFEDLLRQLPRDDLKSICEALGQDSGGREKEMLVRRIVAPTNAANGSTGQGERAESPLAKGGKLTLPQLEAYLWGAADKLRGKIDSSDYKSFIFGFLFLKRLSDVFEEEADKLIASGTAAEVAWEDRDYHRFFVPKRARWSTLQRQATGIGDALNKACAALEEENATLEGVLRGIDFNDENKLGHAKERDELLARLVQHFSKVSLRNADLSEPDMLGRAYEYLIERFADDAGKKGGEFYTPRKVVQFIVELLQPKETDRICDPTVGSGGMLIECAKYVERHGGDPRKLTLHGQENNLGTWAICKMNMLLHGLPDARIEKGDTIRNPRLVKDGVLEVYDAVIANPPFSLDDWGQEFAETDPHGRFRYGLPPKTKGDFAFVQHMIATASVSGRVAVVMPHGVLFRGAAEGDIRAGLVKDDLLEAVIGLGPNLFYGAGIPTAILVFNRAKSANRKRKVLFVHGAEQMVAGTTQQNTLSDENIATLTRAFRDFVDKPRLAKVVAVDEIEANGFNCNITNYVDLSDDVDAPDIDSTLRSLRAAIDVRSEAERRMDERLRGIGYGKK